MLLSYNNGITSVILRVKLLNSSVSTGAGLTGLTSASSGLIISTIADNEAAATAYTQAGSTIETITTLGTFAAPTATKCRFKEVDPTNHPGVYEIQIADARYAVSNARNLLVSISGATNLAQADCVVQLTAATPPANFSVLSIDGSGLVRLSPTSVGEVADAALTTQMTESYAADNVAPTLAQAMFLVQQMLTEFSISGVTLSAKKLDGSTTAATFTLNSATSPTSITRAT